MRLFHLPFPDTKNSGQLFSEAVVHDGTDGKWSCKRNEYQKGQDGTMKKILKISGRILLAVAILIVLALGVLVAAEYRPAEKETVIADHPTETVLRTDEALTLVTWNCGYGALGDNADFFMDGGSSVYTADRERLQVNLTGIRDTLKELDPDFLALQEVDINSSRSYGTDEREILRSVISDASDAFAYNFNTLYMPYPIPPIGHVESGIYTVSRAEIREAERISLPCPFSWPRRAFDLKRCMLVCRFPIAGTEQEFVLTNVHLEAFDSGEGKAAQTRLLRSFLQGEYEKGNYVIACGDFNQRFSNTNIDAYPALEGKWQPGVINEDEFDDSFSLLMDSSVPTGRSLDRPYAGAENESFQFYVIDGFIVSDNIRVESIQTLDAGFTFSDHNPVRLQFFLTGSSDGDGQ